jgi:hypothetical protein
MALWGGGVDPDDRNLNDEEAPLPLVQQWEAGAHGGGKLYLRKRADPLAATAAATASAGGAPLVPANSRLLMTRMPMRVYLDPSLRAAAAAAVAAAAMSSSSSSSPSAGGGKGGSGRGAAGAAGTAARDPFTTVLVSDTTNAAAVVFSAVEKFNLPRSEPYALAICCEEQSTQASPCVCVCVCLFCLCSSVCMCVREAVCVRVFVLVRTSVRVWSWVRPKYLLRRVHTHTCLSVCLCRCSCTHAQAPPWVRVWVAQAHAF